MSSDSVQTIEEMIALTQELLTSNPSSDHTTRVTTCFVGAELRQVHLCLAACLKIRYRYIMNDEPIEEATVSPAIE